MNSAQTDWYMFFLSERPDLIDVRVDRDMILYVAGCLANCRTPDYHYVGQKIVDAIYNHVVGMSVVDRRDGNGEAAH